MASSDGHAPCPHTSSSADTSDTSTQQAIPISHRSDDDIDVTDHTTSEDDEDGLEYEDAEDDLDGDIGDADDLELLDDDDDDDGLTLQERIELLAEEEELVGDDEGDGADNGEGQEPAVELHIQGEDETNGAGDGPRTLRVTRSQMLRFLRNPGLRQLFGDDGLGGLDFGEREDDDDEDYDPRGPGRRRRGRPSDPFPKIPSDEGRALMESGTFGTNERQQGTYKRGSRLPSRMMKRELGLMSPGKERSANKLAAQALIPSSQADMIINYDAKCYSGQFSEDGSFFYSCSQDFRVRMYDTSNPYDWKYYKTVEYPYGQWTITDATLSPDNRFLAYSSIRSMVCLAPTDPSDHSEPHQLEFAQRGRSSGHFGIWSIRFSGDGREIVAGTGDRSVYAYDVETRQTVLRIQGHDDDVNAVCFGDKSSPHLLYSGSDDATIKVWDRRSMSEKRAAGVFLGHTEGLTYIDSKGDGRYVLSNGKDQTMKLWDLRRMVPTEKADKVDSTNWSLPFDYRFETYDTSKYYAHPHDCSLVTFRGHSVLKTLIRCHFSPPGSTDSRYVYSGSENGSVYIYNLDATLAGRIDIRSATYDSRPRHDQTARMFHGRFHDGNGRDQWRTCVRDASWHPNAPMVAATSWNGYGMDQGTCTVHSWNDGVESDEGVPGMGRRVDARLRESRRFQDGGDAPEFLGTTGFMRGLRRRRMEAEDEG